MNILIVHKNKTFNDNFIKKEFPKLSIKKIWKNTFSKKDLISIDLVISIGGDGTFLSASHYIDNQPILGVNSDDKNSEGALTTITIENLLIKLKEVLSGKSKTKEYSREKVILHIGNKSLEVENALNETFFGNINPHHTTNYEIHYKNKIEKQRSSGVVIATGTGSTAWYHAAGGFSFGKTKKQLRFRIRELYKRKVHKPTIKKGKIKQYEKLIVTSKMNHAIIAIDSIRTYSLLYGDKVEISLGKSLKVIQ